MSDPLGTIRGERTSNRLEWKKELNSGLQFHASQYPVFPYMLLVNLM